MLSFGGLFIREKKNCFFLSSSKLIDNLLSIIIHRVTKIPCLKLFLFFQRPYLDNRYTYRRHRGMTQFHLMPLVSHLYVY